MKMKYHYLIFVLTLSLLNYCTDDTNSVINNEFDNTQFTPEDPNAPTISENWKNWIQVNAKKINSLSSNNYSDLQFFKSYFQNKKIIQLGESSHGTQEFSEAKVRLIKFLHQEMGFNIIAFESSVFDCFYTYEKKMNSDAKSAMLNSIFSVWHTEEVKELFNYIIATKKTNNPLKLIGFDIQHSGNSYKFRSSFLKDIFSKIDSSDGKAIYSLDSTLSKISIFDSTSSLLLERADKFKSKLDYFITLLENKWNYLITNQNQSIETLQITKLTLISNQKLIDQDIATLKGENIKSTSIRDSNMAFNIINLSENLYKNEKTIIWAHNYHIRYNNSEVKNTFDTGSQSMGYHLKQYFGDNLYTIGFYMYTGQSAINRRKAVDVMPMSSENMEAVFYWDRYYFSFVDLLNQTKSIDNSWMFKEMKVKYWGTIDQLMIPRNQYDGIFFVYQTHLPKYL